MDNSLDKTPISENTLASLASPEVFNGLSETNQKIIIEEFNKNKDREGGYMGKLLGHNKENAAMNIALVICVLLATIGLICMFCGHECWNVIIPAIMTAVGYIFGRGDR